MKDIACKVLVIGAGPGGYVAAIRAGQLGLDTVIVESERLGGTCLNVGCIPSKAFIHAADEFEKVMKFAGNAAIGIRVEKPDIDLAKTLEWKDAIVTRLNNGVAGLLNKSKVKTVRGWAKFVDGKTVEVESTTGTQTIRADQVIIATGSIPTELPFLPFGGAVISSTEALSLKKIPKRFVVVGGGYIGLELGTAFRKMGSQVTVVELEDRILPQYDAELTRPVTKRLEALGIELKLGCKAKGLSDSGHELIVETSDGKTENLKADKILVTVGRRPATQRWGRDELVLDMNGPFIKVDDRCCTSMRGVFAIGDVTGEPMLAHRAMAQGEMVAEIIAGEKRHWDKTAMPAICFTDPEIVVVGLSPEEARAEGHDVKVGIFPFAANGRAMTIEAEEGFVRLVARSDNHLILGAQAVGRGVADLSASLSLALEMGARLEDVAATIHAHPTQSEAIPEAALKALGHALHI